MGLDLQDFWQKFIFFTDFVAPALSAPEQVICMHAISRTVAVGKAEFSLSLLKLAKLSGFTVLTVQRALARLQERRIIVPAIPEKAKDADKKRVRKIHINTYRVELPTLPLVTLNKVPQRYPHKLLVELGGKAPWAPGVVPRLNDEDRKLLDMMIRGLARERRFRYMELAQSKAQPGQDVELLFKEEVLLNEFGKQRLEPYFRDDV
jgi:hypothetical protein